MLFEISALEGPNAG